MSFQYINPYLIPKNYGYNQGILQNQNVANQQYIYAQNPYQTSFYNQNNIYPYNPMYAPKIAQGYIELGQVKTPNNETLHLFQLNNGQKVAILPRKNEATIVKTFLDGGSMNENDRTRGISHCIEHCLFKGSNKLQDGDVFKLTSLMGASTNASTDFAQTDYYITAPYMSEENLAKTIEIQGDMISNPLFENSALESEKGPICSEISMINDDVTTGAFDKTIRNLFQINSNSHNLVAGSIETVKGLTRNDVVNHHNTYYAPQDLYTVIVGDVDVNKAIELVSKNFTLPAKTTANQHKETLTPIQKSIREDIRSTKTNHTTVFVGFAGPKPQDDKDFIINQMINYYLAESANSSLKEKLEAISGEYGYSLQKVGLKDEDPYALVCVLGLNANDEQKGLDAFYDAIKELQTTPLKDEDMTILNNYIKKELEFSMSNSEDTCDLIGGYLLDNSLNGFSNYKELAQTITKDDIMNYAKKYFNLNKTAITVVHPASVSESDIVANYQKSKYSIQNAKKPQAQTIAFCANQKKFVKNIEEYTLSNNTHLALNNTNSDICAFNWRVNTPPIKPKNPNIPAVLSYMFQKGTNYKNQSELEKFMQLNAIDANVYVNGKSIEISANCLSDNACQTLSLLNELMYNPKLSQNDFEDAKRYVKDTLLASQKNATSNLLDKLYPGFFPTDAEKLKKIDELKLEDVQEFYFQLLRSGSSTFVATAPFDKKPQLKQEIIAHQNMPNVQYKNSTPKLSPIFEANTQTNVIIDTDDLNQAQIRKTYKFPLSGNIEDEAKFELVSTILGGSPSARLFSDLREKQNLAYSVSSYIQSFENTGILTMAIQTTTDDKEQNVQSHDNVKKSLEGFNKHAKLLCEELVSDDELQAAKMKLKQNVIGLCQAPTSETDLLAMNAQEPYGIKRINKYMEIIDKITKEDIKKAANFIFSHNPTTSILASPDTISSQMEYLKTQGRIDKV